MGIISTAAVAPAAVATTTATVWTMGFTEYDLPGYSLDVPISYHSTRDGAEAALAALLQESWRRPSNYWVKEVPLLP